jgi:hypothetical protein
VNIPGFAREAAFRYYSNVKGGGASRISLTLPIDSLDEFDAAQKDFEAAWGAPTSTQLIDFDTAETSKLPNGRDSKWTRNGITASVMTFPLGIGRLSILVSLEDEQAARSIFLTQRRTILEQHKADSLARLKRFRPLQN